MSLTARPAQDKALDVPAVVATARDIAGALAHLHSQSHVHGHLTADRRVTVVPACLPCSMHNCASGSNDMAACCPGCVHEAHH